MLQKNFCLELAKKHKIGKSASRGKRDDDEDDAELMLERENVLGSLKAAHQILQKTNFERYRRNSEKEKRSISEDFDPYDPDDGKDLLKAYMSNVEAYNRQVRSVDDEEEDDDASDKDNFQYRRLAEADLNDGQFVDKFENAEHQEADSSELIAKKRSVEKDVTGIEKKTKSKSGDLKKRSTADNTVKELDHKKEPSLKKEEPEKRSIEDDTDEKVMASLREGSGGGYKKKRALQEDSAVTQIHAPIVGSGGGEIKKRSVPEVKSTVSQLKAPYVGSGGGEIKKRSVPEVKSTVSQLNSPYVGSGGGEIKKRSVPEVKSTESQLNVPYIGSGGGEIKKRSLPEVKSTVSQLNVPYVGSGGGEIKKRSVPEVKSTVIQLNAPYVGSGGGEIKKRSVPDVKSTVSQSNAPYVGSGGGEIKKRSITDVESTVSQLKAPYVGSGGGEIKKRSVPEVKSTVSQLNAPYVGSGGGEIKKRSIPEVKSTVSQLNAPYVGSGGGEIKKRSVPEVKSTVSQLNASYVGSGGGELKKRSLPETKQVSPIEGSELEMKKKRSVPEISTNNLQRTYVGSGVGDKKRRSILNDNEPSIQKVFTAYETSSIEKEKRSLKDKKEIREKEETSNNGENNAKRGLKLKIPPWDSSDRAKIPPWDVSVHTEIPPWDRKRRSVEDKESEHSRKRRDLPNNDVSDGALKMAARSDDINDIEASLQKLESIEKKDVVPVENLSESGSGESDDQGSGEENETTLSKRSAETDTTGEDTKKSKTEGKMDTESDAKLKTDVEKGVDSLLNLVVELYKQQKTIKNFENSVRSLRHDILKELNIPSKDKHAATAKVRNAIQKAAKDRLHILTSSIEHKITEFAKSHPESVKQARLATSLLPKIPLSDEKLAESKREIQRRSAEFDNIEDGFDEQNQLPTILKEHFKRNAEMDVEDLPENPKEEKELTHPKKRSVEDDIDFTPKEEINGEKTLSRMHRDVSESEEEGLDDDYEKLFN